MAEPAKVEVKVESASADTSKPATITVKDLKPVDEKPVEAKAAAAAPVADAKVSQARVKAAAPAKPVKAVKAVKKTAVKPVTAKAAVKKVAAKPAPKTSVKAAAKVAAPVSPFKQIKEKTMTINETIKKQAESAMNQSKAAVEQIQAKAKEAVEQSTKSMEEMNAFARGNVEAMVEAGRVAAKGFESVAQQVVEMTKKNAEATTTAVRTFASAKNANELFQLQSDFARSQFDKMVADGSKLTEMFVKFAGEAFEPISNRFAVAADRIAKAGAR